MHTHTQIRWFYEMVVIYIIEVNYKNSLILDFNSKKHLVINSY